VEIFYVDTRVVFLRMRKVLGLIMNGEPSYYATMGSIRSTGSKYNYSAYSSPTQGHTMGHRFSLQLVDVASTL
jgi:hypothetical protein